MESFSQRYLSTNLEIYSLVLKAKFRIGAKIQTSRKIDLRHRNSWINNNPGKLKKLWSMKSRKSQILNKRRAMTKNMKKESKKGVTDSPPRKRGALFLSKTFWGIAKLISKIQSRISLPKMKPPNKWKAFHVTIFSDSFKLINKESLRRKKKEKTQLIIKVRPDKKAEDIAKDQKVAVGVEAGTGRKRGKRWEIGRRNTMTIQVHSRNSELSITSSWQLKYYKIEII